MSLRDHEYNLLLKMAGISSESGDILISAQQLHDLAVYANDMGYTDGKNPIKCAHCGSLAHSTDADTCPTKRTVRPRRKLMLNPYKEDRWTCHPGSRANANSEERIPCAVIEDDDFTYDAQLYVAGDFGSEEEFMAYAQEIVNKLNEP